jgi:hypothetical protein
LDKDLIIGGASNYEWKDLRNWVNSIKQSGFTGDIVIVGTNMKQETQEKLDNVGVKLFLYGDVDKKTGDIVAPKSGIEPHVERFFYIWNYLDKTEEDYRFVITTDTRDVIFQLNPSDHIKRLTKNYMFSMIASCEGLEYGQEPWGSANFFNTFGPFFHEMYKEALIYNVGVLAGDASTMKGLMMMIFQMAVNRPLRICDQAVYNFIINQEPYNSETMKTGNEDAWAIQLGTTREAILAGFGDIGGICKEKPEYIKTYDEQYRFEQPLIVQNGPVFNHKGEEFVIVHQYDRVPRLKADIDARYA